MRRRVKDCEEAGEWRIRGMGEVNGQPFDLRFTPDCLCPRAIPVITESLCRA